MISIVRSSSNNKDFIDLTNQLDADLSQRYGSGQASYIPYNVIQSLDTVIIAYLEETPVGCGCFKKYDQDCVEIKRMFVRPENRGMGISKKILNELEQWSVEMGFSKAILETGKNQTEAIGLYEKSGYSRIANYDQYIGMSNSLCFGKDLIYRKC
jgi:putative acetyltransferase